MELNALEQAAADHPGWRFEHSTAGTSWYSAHRGDDHLGSPTLGGLLRLVEQAPPAPGSFGGLMDALAKPGF
jgi:hypothetical protein